MPRPTKVFQVTEQCFRFPPVLVTTRIRRDIGAFKFMIHQGTSRRRWVSHSLSSEINEPLDDCWVGASRNDADICVQLVDINYCLLIQNQDHSSSCLEGVYNFLALSHWWAKNLLLSESDFHFWKMSDNRDKSRSMWASAYVPPR